MNLNLHTHTQLCRARAVPCKQDARNLMRCCRHVNNLNYKTVQSVVTFGWHQLYPWRQQTALTATSYSHSS